MARILSKPWLLGLVALGLILWYSLHQTAKPATDVTGPRPNYTAQRAAKDSVWYSTPESPLPDSLRSRFRGLKYFVPTDSFRVTARYTALSTLQPILMPLTHRDAPEPYVRVGRLQFTINGKSCTLTALRRPAEPADAPLFIPFTDATTGRATYGGGRYLNLAPPAVDATSVTLDFNLAYTPTCAYVPDFECPVPPKENALPVAIRAGERD